MVKRNRIAEKILVILMTLMLVISPLLAVHADGPVISAPSTQTINYTTPSTTPSVPVAPVAPTAPNAPSSGRHDSNPVVTPTTSTPTDTTTVTPTPDATATPDQTTANDTAGSSSDVSQSDGTTSDSNQQGNSDTGSSSTNTTNTNVGNNSSSGSGTNIDNQNNANVGNTVNLDASSGNNSSSYNTGNGSVSSGDANVVLSILNLINTVFIAPTGGQIGLFLGNFLGSLIGDYVVDPASGEAYSLTGSRLDVGNSDTGAGSQNTAIVNAGDNTTINNTNNGVLDNNINLSANTGNNQSSYNTGNGQVTSGNANISLNLLNFLNSVFVARDSGLVGILNVFGDFIGNLVIPKSLAGSSDSSGQPLNVQVSNNTTGADSTNQANVNVDNSTNINNDNTSDIGNDVSITGSTGDNSAGYNTGNGNVSSGDVNEKLDVDNTANQSFVGDTFFYAIINVLGNWDGVNELSSLFNTIVLPNPNGGETILVTNANTGANSENKASVDVMNNTDINNTNNFQINNNVDINANTGGNSSSYNTGNGSVTSGNVNVLANILNLSNISVVANKFAFFVINIFGDWKGDISDTASNKMDSLAAGETTTTTTVSSGNKTLSTTTSNVTGRTLFSSAVSGTNILTPIFVGDVLSATAPKIAADTVAADTTTPFTEFLQINVWNILIALGVLMLVSSLILYLRQRRLEEEGLL